MPSADRGPAPLTTRAILTGAAVLVLIGSALLVTLLVLYGDGTPQDQAHLDAVRTAGSIVIGTGGAVALLLAARRQRSTELTLEHQREVAAATEHDANERRVTEIYAQAAGQLGSDKAPVRLAALYSLERLGMLNPGQRETIVNVLCAYLRMPATAPADRPGPGDGPAPADRPAAGDHREHTEEWQVRQTAQWILHRHRKVADPGDFWTVPLYLDGANLQRTYLPGIDLTEASLYRADLTGADFTGAALTHADLTATTLAGTDFTGADLTAATLDDADLTAANFTGATLAGTLLTGATWSVETVWPAGVEAAVAAASTGAGDGRRWVGELTMPVTPG